MAEAAPGTEDLLALDDSRLRAMLAADATALEALLHTDLAYTHSDGRTDSRATYLAALRSGALRYHRCERESAAAVVQADMAMVEGRLRLYAFDQAQQKGLLIRYLAVWLRTPAQAWRLRAWASTLIQRLA
jgi:hypothetical protein